MVVVTPAVAKRVIAAAKAHDRDARAADRDNVPYYERARSEEKLKAFPEVKWR